MKPIIDYGLAYKYLDWSTVHTVVDEPKSLEVIPLKTGIIVSHGLCKSKEALLQSWNIPAVSTFQEVLAASSKDVIADMESLGIDMSTEDENLTLPYAIGGWANGVSPIELASVHMLQSLIMVFILNRILLIM